MNDSELEAALSQMRPRSSRVQRDQVMYQAGRASRESTSRRRWLRSSTTAAGWLLAAGFCGLWIRQPKPVVVTKIQYIERAESTPGQSPAALATDTGPAQENLDGPDQSLRVRRQGRDYDLDALLAINLIRTRRIPERAMTRAVNQDSDRSDTTSDHAGRNNSYIALMRSYRNSSRTGSFVGEQL